MRPMILSTLLFLASSCRADPAPKAQSEPKAQPAPQPEPQRIVAIGDLHADLDNALGALRLAGLVDEAGHWAAGETVFVQTGDLTDRGPDSKEVIELMMRLEQEAETAGGKVVSLLGNHEVMNMMGDWRYVSKEDLADFEGKKSVRQKAFSRQGELGTWLRERDAAAKVGSTVFVHGGVSRTWAKVDLELINRQVRAAIHKTGPPTVLDARGPLWYRDYLQKEEVVACPDLDKALTALGAKRMVVGHTTQRTGKVASRCGGRLLGIDTGIADHYGAHLSAVEILAGDARAIYPSGREDLPDPESGAQGVGSGDADVTVGAGP